MSDLAIKVEDLGKAYRLGVRDERPETLVQAVASAFGAPLRNFRRLRRLDTFSTERQSDDILWALKDVSFEIREGEAVGFVGRNGAGKSTLLKILSRITEPTKGRVMLRGRISSLLEVGTGFHPELTGRENIYMNGTILGMRKGEIKQKFDAIVDFSGVERFLDTPIKRYSSGMKVRLAFSVAAHLDPDMLIIDEVLAVGDAEFQRKCLGKMEDVTGQGRTVLFVSHNMSIVQALCGRVIQLQDGMVVQDGEASDVVRRYYASLNRPEIGGFGPENKHRSTRGSVVLTGGRVLDEQGEETVNPVAGRPTTFEFDYENPEGHDNLNVTIVIRGNDDTPVFQLHPRFVGQRVDAGRRGSFRCTLPRLPLPLGDFRVAVQVSVDGEKSDHIPNAIFFSVQSSVFHPNGQAPTSKVCAAQVEQIWDIRSAAGGAAGGTAGGTMAEKPELVGLAGGLAR